MCKCHDEDFNCNQGRDCAAREVRPIRGAGIVSSVGWVLLALVILAVLLSGCNEDRIRSSGTGVWKTPVDENGVACYGREFESRTLSCVKVRP